MSKKSTKKTKTNAPAEIENKDQLVNFVANNILNNITLNQVVTLVQQVSLRDANTIVTEADEAKLKEITTAFTDAVNQSEQAAAEQAAAAQTSAESTEKTLEPA